MKIVNRNIWDDVDELDYIGVTTNSTLKKTGDLVMGAGIAKEAKKRYPECPKFFGEIVKKRNAENGFYGMIIYNKIFALQTKVHWRDKSPIEVVEKSLAMLSVAAGAAPHMKIGIPFPAINNGGRSVEDIMPLLQKLPDNITVYKI